jgi:asparaginyl-tRNA synthetase
MEVEWGKDLRTLEEEQLMKHYDLPLIVTKYPKSVKAFYMKEDPENPDVVQCFDVLAPEGHGEIVGGSMREENYESIKERLVLQGENPDNYTWYLDLRKFGSVPHGGFGLGIERVVKWICNLDNIRDTIPYPRTINRSTP